MKLGSFGVPAFVLAAALMAPMTASALSIADYQKENPQQQSDSYAAAAKQAILGAYKTTDPAILAKYGTAEKYGETVEHYFTDVPKGEVEPLAFTAFQAELDSFLKDPQTTPADMTTDQVDDFIKAVIQIDMPEDLAKVQKAPSPQKAPPTSKP